jgi:RNA polymerase sigma-70 factor (ECF subfamily)
MESPETTSEHELLARHSRGDRRAFAELVALFRAPVHNYFVRCGVDATTRDDLLQETFSKIHLAAGRYRPERPLKVWIFTIAANTVRSYFRKQAVHARFFAHEPPLEPASDEPSTLEVVSFNEAADWLGDEITRLPLVQREVVVLMCIEGLGSKDVAGVLEIPEGSVKSNLRRARLTLAKKLLRRRLASEREVAR